MADPEQERLAPASFRSNREIAIHVDDLDRAEAFYAGVLGGRVVARSEACVEIDTGELRLYANRWGHAPRAYIPSFDVPDRDAARRRLLAAGTRTVAAAADGGAEYFVDPFGFVFDLVERAPSHGATPAQQQGEA